MINIYAIIQKLSKLSFNYVILCECYRLFIYIPSQIHMLKSDIQRDGIWKWDLWEVIRPWVLIKNITGFIREIPQSSLIPFSCKDAVRNGHLINQEVGSHQTVNLLMPWSWTSQLSKTVKKLISIVSKPSSLWNFVRAAQRTKIVKHLYSE